MFVPAGQSFTTTLISPGGLPTRLGSRKWGARIEVPVTRAIVCYWRPARLDGWIYSVELEAPPAAPLTPPELGDDPAIREALAAGAFQIVWRDNGPEPPIAEIWVPLFTYTGAGPGWGGAPDEWPVPDVDAVTPTVDDVAELLRTRTYEDGMGARVTFTDRTRPTAGEVERLIERAVPVVLTQLRPTFPETLYGQVAHAVALYTAVLVEGSYFREQLGESQVALYRDLYGLAIGGLTSTIEQALAEARAGALRLA